MIIRFSKYHGTGNDFIMIDNRSFVFRSINNSTDIITHICHRRFGAGADGLILINSSHIADFEMIYFNSDGKEGSMCGNGGRCSVAFAKSLGLVKDNIKFVAVDGLHEAVILEKHQETFQISLKMQDVKDIEKHDKYFVLDTGSPHYVCFTENVEKLDVNKEGRKIRYSKAFEEKGINVNFAEVRNGKIFVRTYERGVEDETLSCGTGVTATALASCLSGYCKNDGVCNLDTPGGSLIVRYNKVTETAFSDIWLEGPAVCAFKGEINI